MTEQTPQINYRKCKWCGHKPEKEPNKFCPKCGKSYKDVYSKLEEETMPEGFRFTI
jgi:rubrerythrin